MGYTSEESSIIDSGVALVQLHYQDRNVVTSWKKTLEEFEGCVRGLLGINTDHETIMTANLNSLGAKVLSESAWPLLEGRIADVFIFTRTSESAPKHAENGDIDVLTRTGVRYPFLIPDFSLATISDLGKMIQELDGIPLDQQRFLYNGRELEEGRTLSQYEIAAGATIGVVRRSRSNEDWSKVQAPLRCWQASHPPTIRVQPPRAADQGNPILIRLADSDRQVVAIWNTNLKEFEADVCPLLDLSPGHPLALSVELQMFGNSKMELDQGIWLLLEGQIRTVWVSPQELPEEVAEPVTVEHAVKATEITSKPMHEVLRENALQLVFTPSTYLFLHFLLFLVIVTIHHPDFLTFLSFTSFFLTLCHFMVLPANSAA